MAIVIDYQGLRLLAMPALPINSNSTIQYGSNDKGKNIQITPELGQLMKTLAEHLNLAGHPIKGDKAKILFGPVDLEGHLGKVTFLAVFNQTHLFALVLKLPCF